MNHWLIAIFGVSFFMAVTEINTYMIVKYFLARQKQEIFQCHSISEVILLGVWLRAITTLQWIIWREPGRPTTCIDTTLHLIMHGILMTKFGVWWPRTNINNTYIQRHWMQKSTHSYSVFNTSGAVAAIKTLYWSVFATWFIQPSSVSVIFLYCLILTLFSLKHVIKPYCCDAYLESCEILL